MNEILLTPSATARLIEKSEQSIRIYAATGKLACILTTTGRRLFRKSDIEASSGRWARKARQRRLNHSITYPVSQKKLYRGFPSVIFILKRVVKWLKRNGPCWTFFQGLVFPLTAPLPGAIASRHMERNHRHGLLP